MNIEEAKLALLVGTRVRNNSHEVGVSLIQHGSEYLLTSSGGTVQRTGIKELWLQLNKCEEFDTGWEIIHE